MDQPTDVELGAPPSAGQAAPTSNAAPAPDAASSAAPPSAIAPSVAAPGFLAAVGDTTSFDDPHAASRGPRTVPTGDAPAPFGALDGTRLAGPSGAHPLAGVSAADLIAPITDGLEGAIELDGPGRVGEGISGRIRVRARTAIKARGAALRLVGVRISEQARSGPSREADAHAALAQAQAAAFAASGGKGAAPVAAGPTSTVSWVEVHGEEIESSTFTEPALPTLLAPGQVVEVPFSIPAPRLGPPSAHAGSALIAWAVEARWDVQLGGDQRVAALVDVAQHPDLLRSGAVQLPSGAMFDMVQDEGATLSVDPLPPVPAGQSVRVGIVWPDAPGGRSARVELTTDVKCSNGISVTSVSVPADHDALEGTQVVLPLPVDLPPTLVMDGLTVGHRLRVIVDRKLRTDATAERPIVII